MEKRIKVYLGLGCTEREERSTRGKINLKPSGHGINVGRERAEFLLQGLFNKILIE